MPFEPIAIVGRACVVPGASSPEQLWDVVANQRDEVSSADPGAWQTGPEDIVRGPGDDPTNGAWNDRGGYVRGFERVWDPEGFAVPAATFSGLDPLFTWVLHCARQALRDAGDTRTGNVSRPAVRAVLGNLSFPTAGMNGYAQSVWSPQGQSAADPRNRFMSSGPAKLLEEALGLCPGAFCLDGACASSLYAIAVACDQLHDGRADLVLAGAVNRADDLFLHVGFCALKALSPSGASRPFNADADGLLPAEGAGVVALKRLADARRDGNTIYGVIRGVGLSNDGRGRGFLAPSEEGQRRALAAAYDRAGIAPRAVSLLECHATGTVLGDATELRSTASVFADCSDVPIGSLKSNLGHLITAAGIAGLIKVLEAMRHKQRPATLHVDTQNPALTGGPFRVLREPEPWPSEGPRVAGVSAFGFGGNNAHLIVSEDDPSLPMSTACATVPSGPLAVVGVGAIVGTADNADAFAAAVRDKTSLVQPADNEGRPSGARVDAVSLELGGLCFPPRDLQRTIAQQLLVLSVARRSAEAAPPLPRERTGIYVAMEADPEVCRYGLRWRLPHRVGQSQRNADATVASLQDAIAPPLGAEEVVGTMPNIPANRINRQLDLGGLSYTVAAGEASGRVALELAARALRTGQLDAAIVGGVDLSCHPVHEAALAAIEGEPVGVSGDAASALVLRRLDDAVREGDPILAVIDSQSDSDSTSTQASTDVFGLRSTAGRCWAAGDLRDVTAAVLVARDSDGASTTIPGRPGGEGWTVQAGPATAPCLVRFAAADRAALEQRLASVEPGGDGPCRVAILAATNDELRSRCAQTLTSLRNETPVGPGVYLRLQPLEGDLAFVFTGAGAAYPDMGRPLLDAFGELDDTLRARCPVLAEQYDLPWPDDHEVPPLQRLWSSSYLSQVHAEFSRSWLGLHAQALVGYSSGESNALFAAGIWSDHDAMVEQCRDSGIFTEQVGGPMQAVARCWAQPVQWETWTVLAPVSQVVELVDATPRVHVSIIHHDAECVVAGDAAGCAAVRAALPSAHFSRLHYDLAVHVPELQEVAKPWRALHRRPVTAPSSDVRVYSGAHAAAYRPTEDACADAILGQADRRLDYRRVIEQAYADGVRIFVEHGPQGSCSRWIREILGERDAVVVALDRKRGGLTPVLETIAELWSAGVPLRLHAPLQAFVDRTVPSPAAAAAAGPELRLATRPQPLRMPPLSSLSVTTDLQPMPPAPTLPAVASMPPAPTQASVAPTASALAQPSAVVPPPTAVHAPQVGARPMGIAEVMQAQLVELGSRQRAFVEAQAALHHRFLSVQAQANHVLVNAVGAGGVASAPIVSPPMPTPVAPPVPAAAPVPVAPVPVATRPVPTPAPAPIATPVPVATPIRLASPARATTSTVIDSSKLVPHGPTFDRAALEIHAGGAISEIYGSEFAVQDGFVRQVRMPLPPLLLADRVTGLDAEPMSMKLGTIWTETDVTEDAWYLHAGRMPPGIMIESGQADLMLISYLGVDAENKGERVYRLLGCTLTYHGSPPAVGETLAFDIHLDGHAKQGKSRLMFFHYNCHIDGKPRLSVRQGQAGFFTDAELADSDGCLWSPEDQEIVESPRLDPPAITTQRSFSEAQVRAFAEGRPWDCFGDGVVRTRCHTRTPTIQSGRMQLLSRVDSFEPEGGPWKRGYLKASTPIRPDDWFFDGHFLNDPCMPGTLMFEGCLQALSFYLAAMGYTVERDGWRFEPVPEQAMTLSCRGQVTPSAKDLHYEVFVEEVWDGPEPTVFADLLCTVDGLKAFHARRVGLRLVPAWPLDEGHPLLDKAAADKEHAVARSGDFRFDQRSMLACASGRPTEAFGPIYARFDGVQPVPRLPNPPYHFISRATHIEGEAGGMEAGGAVQVDLDLDPNAWYFADNGCRSMPFAVLLEAALQPCGWLASYMGCALTVDQPLMFRNLDGSGTLHREVRPDDGVLSTHVRNTQLSVTASMIIVGFDVECKVKGELVYSMSTVFGFFPASAFENQAGLPASDVQRALFDATAEQSTRALQAVSPGRPRMAETMLMMLDRIVYFDPQGGEAGLGSARAEKDVNPGEWFFAAHFFQDPVQPGSLGIEAMLQLLQWCMRELELDAEIDQPRFEPIAVDRALTWKYRGQVVPTNLKISTTLEITERGRDERGAYAIADAWLWVDGKQIYSATGVGMRIVGGDDDYGRTLPLNLRAMPWLRDHCPTWTVPAVPMMSMVDMLGGAARADERLSGLRDIRVKGWLTVPEGSDQVVRIEREGSEVSLRLEGEGADERLVATGRLCIGRPGDRPEPLPVLVGDATPLPYDDGALFHGPSFQRVVQLVRGEAGASSIIRLDPSVDTGLAPFVLDAATHGIPHDALHQWDARIPEGRVAYPAWIPELDVYGPLPAEDTLRCEVRYRGPMGQVEFPSFEIQLIGSRGVWCRLVLVEACFPKGRLGAAPPAVRRAFLRDRVAAEGLSLSRVVDDGRRLTTEEVHGSNWLPGTVEGIFGTQDVETIARNEHIAAAHGLHPHNVEQRLPLTTWNLDAETQGAESIVRGDGEGALDITPVVDFWTRWFDHEPWPGEDLYYGLLERFLRRVVVADPEAFSAVRGRSAIYLANHQVGVESILFSIVVSALSQVPTVTLAKMEHRKTWLGQLIEHCFSYPGIADPGLITFFDRSDPSSLTTMIPDFAERMKTEGRSMMVHVEGTRSTSCAEPVRSLSGAFIELALAVGAPVVPVRFSGGLPREALPERLEFPLAMGRQDIWLGAPISADELAALNYGERRQRVLAAINDVGPSHEDEQPIAGDPVFAQSVAKWEAQRGVSHGHAAVHQVLVERAEPCPQVRRLLQAKSAEELRDDDTPQGRWLQTLANWLL